MWLYCVRHGESVHNAEGRIQGQLDVPLSDFGRRQGEAIAEALAALPIDAIYASPLLRALETAQIVARRLRLPIRTDDRLKEINVGVFQDRLRAEVAQLYPDEFARWTSGEPDFAVPGGESRRDLQERGCAPSATSSRRDTGTRRSSLTAACSRWPLRLSSPSPPDLPRRLWKTPPLPPSATMAKTAGR